MKIAIFHDYLDFIGGGERLILILAKHLNATVITTNYRSETLKKFGYDVPVVNLGDTTSKVPWRLLSATWKFLTCNFKNDFDFFILSGNWAHFASFKHRPNLFYCHTPPRVFYDLKSQYYAQLKGTHKKVAFKIWTALHSKFDLLSIKYVDDIVVNSKNVQKRVRKYYHRNSEVVYTPIECGKFYNKPTENYWLSVNRLYPEKRIDLQFEIFRELKDEYLKIVGGKPSFGYAKDYIASLGETPENVELLGEVPEDKLLELYAKCKGLITTSIDEDLGRNALEAMASGKPVIAVNEGGYRETVIDNVTGWLLPLDKDQFISKISSLTNEQLESMKNNCLIRAREFDVEKFVNKIKGRIRERKV